MTTVSEGMDVAKVRHVAASMIGLSGRMDDVKGRGKAQAATLQQAWEGPDLEKFTERWHDALPAITHAGQALRDFGRDLHHQADQQVTASDGAGAGPGGRPRVPTIPPCPFPPLPPGARRVFERIWEGLKDSAKKVLEGIGKILDGISAVFNNALVKAGLLVNDLIEGLKKVSDDFVKWADDLAKKAGSLISRWAPKLIDLGESVLPVVKFLGKFAKAIPVLGVVAAVWDAKDVFVDLWNGKVNWHDVWNKIVLGGGSAVAGFFPGPGTLISVALTLEQMRYEHMPKLYDWAESKGIPKVFVPGLTPLPDFIPDKDFDIPGPAPKEIFGDMWDQIRSGQLEPPIIGIPPGTLPWP